MAKTTKRSRGDVLVRKAMQHHDFIGQAEPERQQAREATQARVQRDHEVLEKEMVREMAHEVEAAAGLREPAEPAKAPKKGLFDFQRPHSLREAIEMIQGRGPELLEMLREKAEERLAKLPKPVVDFTGRAATVLLLPVRLGTGLVQSALRTPAALWRALSRQKREA